MGKKDHYTEFIDRMHNSIPDAGTVKSAGDRIIAAIESEKHRQPVMVRSKHTDLWKIYLSGAAAAFLLAFGVVSLMKNPQSSDEYREKQAALATGIPVIDPERKLLHCRYGIPMTDLVTNIKHTGNDNQH